MKQKMFSLIEAPSFTHNVGRGSAVHVFPPLFLFHFSHVLPARLLYDPYSVMFNTVP